MDRAREQSDQIVEGKTAGRFIELARDPQTVINLCCGDHLPLLGPEQAEEVAKESGRRPHHHLACAIWQAELERIAEEREALLQMPERPTTTPFGIGQGGRDPALGFDRADEAEMMAEAEKLLEKVRP